MADGTRLLLEEARKRARRLQHELRSVTIRCLIVGSVRRRRDTVGDLELLVEPKKQGATLFGDPGAPDLDAVRDVVHRWGDVKKDGDRMQQVVLPDGVQAEVYLVHPPASWGTLQAIRTGPAELGRRAVTRLRERGRRSLDGAVWEKLDADEGMPDTGRVFVDDDGARWRRVETPTEQEFFHLAGLELVPPWKRDEDVPARRWG